MNAPISSAHLKSMTHAERQSQVVAALLRVLLVQVCLAARCRMPKG